MPMVDARPIPWTPREVANATTRMEAEEDDSTTVGMQMWPRGPGNPFWESFPPLIDINKRQPKIINRRTSNTAKCSRTRWVGIRSD